MRRTSVAVILTFISVLWGRCDVFYTVQPVDFINFEGDIWNLRDVESHGHEFNYRLEQNDTCRRLWSPTQRFDLIERGDTLLLTCTEKRKFRLNFSRSIPINKYNTVVNSVDSFYVKGRILQSEFLTGRGIYISDKSRRGYCSGLTDDSYIEATLLHNKLSFEWYVSTDSLLSIRTIPSDNICTTTIESYRIMVEGEEFPRAFKREIVTRSLDQTISCDSLFWVYEPKFINSEISRHKSRLNLTDIIKEKINNEIKGFDFDDSTIKVNHEGGMLHISSSINRIAHLQICDIIGRVYYETTINLSDDPIQIQLPHLPIADYIISITDDSQNKLYVSKILRAD